MEEDCAVFVAVGLRLAAKAEFAGDLRGAFVGADENDFDIWMEARPGLDSVALDDADVSG
jgi:hypothetical protein